MHPNANRVTRRNLLCGILAATAIPSLAQSQSLSNAAPKALGAMRLRATFNGQTFTASLYDNPTARDLFSLAPLTLSIEDYANNEKIAHLPRKLTEEASGPFANEAPGDLCYYAPWGNLAFFYAGYRYSQGLIRLGRLDDGVSPLLTRGKFALQIERVS